MRRVTYLILVLAFTMTCLSQTATEYTDKDKKKMAEIAQRPEVQQRIEAEWKELRANDLTFAYNVNSSTRLGQLSPSNLADLRQKYGQLYDNPILLRYVNSLGQRLVPRNSPNLYSFRLLLDPLPKAVSLSTGTIYVSTGLVSMLDNEAQLSYVLAHEIAHVEKKHHYNKIRNNILEEELDKQKEADATKRRGLFSALSMAAGAGLGAAAGGAQGAMLGSMAGLAGGQVIGALAFKNRFEVSDWDKITENEADEAGFKYVLDQNYDVREIPRLYSRLDGLVSRDNRVGLSFIGDPQRVRERTSQVNALLVGNFKADIDRRMKEAGGLVGSTPEFSLLMSSLKRDNGVVALEYDLYAMAKDNLEDAARLRSNDPRVHYYLGQVTALTGRTAQEKQQAIKYFTTAIQYDNERGAYPEPHLENALYMISQNDPAQGDTIKNELKTYVALYQRQHAGALPPNMHIIYDYFLLAGDNSWYVPPAMAVSTKDVDALTVMSVGAPPANNAAAVIDRALGRPMPASLKK